MKYEGKEAPTPQTDEDIEIAEWMNRNRKKNNGYGEQIRRALKKLFEEEKGSGV